MKKGILITLGIILILVILAVWVYLFMFGAPKSGGDIFANFGSSGDVEIPIDTDTDVVDVGTTSQTGKPQALKQLTTRPVAGAGFTQDGIRYVEQGTGHIYSINLTSGAETLLSGTTIPGTRSALFQTTGDYVVITAVNGASKKSIVGKVEGGGDGIFKGLTLPFGTTHIAWGKATSTLMYAIQGTSGTSGYSYNVIKGAGAQIFNIPLRDIKVLWGDAIYVYTVPTAYQTGYIYKVVKNDVRYVTEGGIGLMSFLQNNDLIVTTTGETGVRSILVNTNTGTSSSQALPYIAEKCTTRTSFMYCAVPSDIPMPKSFPDDWYKGTVSYSDRLVYTNTKTGHARILSDFLLESGREIDVSSIGTNTDGTYVYFINKNDNTLWMFDTTI